MTTPSFGNPVQGPRIVPRGEKRKPTDVLPSGHPGFRVTATTEMHLKRKPFTPALDLGNFHAGDPVVAMADGVVSYTELAQGIVRVDHGDGWSTGCGHMTGLNVSGGQNVRRGHLLGRVGKAGTSEVHLHFDITHNGQRLDAWPLLEQNREPDMLFRDPTVTEQWDVLKGTTFTRARDGSSSSFSAAEAGLWSIAELTVAGVDCRLIDYGTGHELLIIPRTGLVPRKGTRIVGVGVESLLSRISRARTALRGAGQAVSAADEALR